MDTVIGLGSAGCKIADQFSKFPQYDVFKIDVGIKGENSFPLNYKNTPEEYEQAVPDMTDFFKAIEGDILFIVGGGGKISGATLQILKQLSHCNINILYIKPYAKSLTKTGFLQDRLVFNVLQEYTRSGLFAKLFIVDNVVIESLTGDVPILEYNNKLNELIVNAIHYFNVFNNTESVVENKEPPKDIYRICTLGIYDLKNNNETLFFNLQNIAYKCYYHAIPEAVLKTDGKLFKLIKEKAAEEHSSYQIHSTKHADIFSYFIAQTNFIQTVDSVG
jgi:hypothetical protein